MRGRLRDSHLSDRDFFAKAVISTDTALSGFVEGAKDRNVSIGAMITQLATRPRANSDRRTLTVGSPPVIDPQRRRRGATPVVATERLG